MTPQALIWADLSCWRLERSVRCSDLIKFGALTSVCGLWWEGTAAEWVNVLETFPLSCYHCANVLTGLSHVPITHSQGLRWHWHCKKKNNSTQTHTKGKNTHFLYFSFNIIIYLTSSSSLCSLCACMRNLDQTQVDNNNIWQTCLSLSRYANMTRDVVLKFDHF